MQPTHEWLTQPGGLAERLRALRLAAGLTGVQLATQLGWPQSKIPKIENGRQMPSTTDVESWARATCQPGETGPLLALLTESQAVHHQWRHKLRAGHAALQDEYDALVRSATVIRNCQVLLIPGLLQTPDYARARFLEAVRMHGTDPAGVDAAVQARMRRQEALYDQGKTFEFTFTAATMTYLLCPAPAMAGQLDRLLVASQLPNVTLNIIPPGVELPVAPILSFIICDDVTVVETPTGQDTVRGDESDLYGRMADELAAEAVTGDKAQALITAAAAALR